MISFSTFLLSTLFNARSPCQLHSSALFTTSRRKKCKKFSPSSTQLNAFVPVLLIRFLYFRMPEGHRNTIRFVPERMAKSRRAKNSHRSLNYENAIRCATAVPVLVTGIRPSLYAVILHQLLQHSRLMVRNEPSVNRSVHDKRRNSS